MDFLNRQIRENIVAYMNNELPSTYFVQDDEPGQCMRLVRQLISGPLNIHSGDAWAFYQLVLTHRSKGNETGTPWARSVQKSFREAGYQIPMAERTGGDLVFNWRLAPEGHVVLLLSRDWCIENTKAPRGGIVSGYNRLSLLNEQAYGDEMEAYRLPASLRQGAR